MLAWRHTFTKRWPAVKSVRTSITHRIGTISPSNSRREAERDDALGPLHQAAPGVEPERLGLGPLVGDQQRGGEHRERQHGDAPRLGGGEEPGDATEEQGVGEPVGHRVEEGAPGRGGAGGLGDRAVEHVGDGGEGEEQQAGAQGAVADGDARRRRP